MIRIAFATLLTMPHQFYSGLGSALVLFMCERTYQFSGRRFVGKGIDSMVSLLRNASRTESFASAKWLNPDQLAERGRGRLSLSTT